MLKVLQPLRVLLKVLLTVPPVLVALIVIVSGGVAGLLLVRVA